MCHAIPPTPLGRPPLPSTPYPPAPFLQGEFKLLLDEATINCYSKLTWWTGASKAAGSGAGSKGAVTVLQTRRLAGQPWPLGRRGQGRGASGGETSVK